MRAFNNAGIEQPYGAIADVTEDDWDRIVAINLRGVFPGMKYLVPVMLRQGGGAIVSTSSSAGVIDINVQPLTLVRGAKTVIAPMTDRLPSSYERDWSPYTKKTARSAVFTAIGQALNSRYEVPQESPREMLALSMRLKFAEER